MEERRFAQRRISSRIDHREILNEMEFPEIICDLFRICLHTIDEHVS